MGLGGDTHRIKSFYWRIDHISVDRESTKFRRVFETNSCVHVG